MSFESIGQRLDDHIDSFKWRWRQRWRRLTGYKPPPTKPGQYLSAAAVTCEAIKQLRNSNAFLLQMAQNEDLFNSSRAKIGQSLRICLPNDFHPNKDQP